MVGQREDKHTFTVSVRSIRKMTQDGKSHLNLAALKQLPTRIPCHFGLSIWDTGTAALLSKPWRKAELVARHTTEGSKLFMVEMQEYFREPIERFLRPDCLLAQKKYEVQLSLSFNNTADSSDFLCHLDPVQLQECEYPPTRFSARWAKLPEVPGDGQLLRFSCAPEEELTDTNLGVEVEMRWTTPSEKTVLASWNKALRSKQINSSNKSTTAASRQYKVSYAYPNEAQNSRNIRTRQSKPKMLEIQGLRCRHCPGLEFPTPKEFKEHHQTQHPLFQYTFDEEPLDQDTLHILVGCKASIQLVYSYPSTQDRSTFDQLQCPHCTQNSFGNVEELRLHLECLHPNLKYTLGEPVATNDGVVQIVLIGVLDTSYADKRASDNVPDARAVSVVGPKRPFNRKKHLAGKNRWVQEAKQQQTKRKQAEFLQASEAPTQRKAPEEVKDIPQPERKKFKVPTGRKRAVYRLSSKRPLVPGEYVSETDDDIDRGPAKLKLTAFIKGQGYTKEQENFILLWNEWMLEEKLTSYLFVGDACVRLTKHLAQTGQVQDPALVAEFEKKLRELLEDQIIDKAVLDWCLARLHPQPSNAALQSDDQHRPRKRLRRTTKDDTTTTTTTSTPQKPDNPAVPTATSTASGARSSRGKARSAVQAVTPQTTDSDDVDMSDDVPNPGASAKEEGTEDVEMPYGLCVCGESAEAKLYQEPILRCCNYVSFPSSFSTLSVIFVV